MTWGSYLTSVTAAEAPDDTTVVLTLEKPNAVLPLLPIPIVPEHVWSSIDEKAVKTYQAEPTDGQPVVGSGPFRLVEGTAGGSTYRFERNPDYWQGVGPRRRGRLPRLQGRGPDGPGAGQGRDRLRRGDHRPPGALAGGRGGHHRAERRLPRLRRDRVQHRGRRPGDRGAHRRRARGAQGPGLPLRAPVRDRPRADRRACLPGRRRPGRHDHPGDLRATTTGRRRRRTRRSSTSTRRTSCSPRPATREVPTASG